MYRSDMEQMTHARVISCSFAVCFAQKRIPVIVTFAEREACFYTMAIVRIAEARFASGAPDVREHEYPRDGTA